MRKASQPESTRQAQTWDTNFNAYKAGRFCPPCASQASWGHQIGFSLASDVGDCCRGKATPKGYDRAERWANRVPVIETLPTPLGRPLSPVDRDLGGLIVYGGLNRGGLWPWSS